MLKSIVHNLFLAIQEMLSFLVLCCWYLWQNSSQATGFNGHFSSIGQHVISVIWCGIVVTPRHAGLSIARIFTSSEQQWWERSEEYGQNGSRWHIQPVYTSTVSILSIYNFPIHMAGKYTRSKMLIKVCFYILFVMRPECDHHKAASSAWVKLATPAVRQIFQQGKVY